MSEHETEAPVPTPADPVQDMDAAMDEIWDRHVNGQDEETPVRSADNTGRDEKGRFKAAEAVEAPQDDEDKAEAPEGDGEPEETAEDATEEPETPELTDAERQHIPYAVRKHWAAIPPDAQAAIVAHQQSIQEKLSEAGRIRASLEPVAESLQHATEIFPQLRGMDSKAIGNEIAELVRVRAQIEQDPVGTIIGMAEQMGITPLLAQHLGEPGQQDIMQSVDQRINAAIQAATAEAQQAARAEVVEQQIIEFSKGIPEWGLLEPHLLGFIQQAQESHPDLADLPLLEVAVDAARKHFGLKAPESAAAEAPATDTKRDAAAKAKSINVKSTATRPRPPTDDEAMDEVWARHMA